MRTNRLVLLGLILALLTPGLAQRASADEAPPRPPPPAMPGMNAPARAAPTTAVPVPDVRGLSEGEARYALTRAGLNLGGVEHLSIAQLQRQLGRTYAPGIVVQQAPAPATNGSRQMLRRGALVWLRVSAPAATPQPGPRLQPRPVTPPPVSVTTLPEVGAPARPGGFAPSCQPDPAAAGVLRDIRNSVSLPCERRRSRWHARAVGGWTFTAGDESGDSGFLAGVDIGRTFAGCIGVDLYYRYTAQTFDRVVTGGLLEDAGGFHHVGLVANYQGSFSRTSRFYWYVGLGLGWFMAEDYQRTDSGLEGYFQGGLGYMLTNDMRLRFGLDAFAVETKSGHLRSSADGSSRLLWMFSPTLALEFDF